MAPMVANITDDNGDGVVDLNDTPDVIFSTFQTNYHADGVIRVVDGKTGVELLNTASLSRVASAWEIAVGDINNDGFNEILAYKDISGRNGPHPLIAFRYNITTHLLEELWTAPESSGQRPAPAIADINHDGKPEIISETHILNGEDGTIYCRFANPVARMPIVEDTNNDGFMDVIGGKYIYSGNAVNKVCPLLTPTDNGVSASYVAMADMDIDGIPEIISISGGYLNIFDLLLNPKIEPFALGGIGGGPPTVANFKHDTLGNNSKDHLEIAVAGADYYSVIRPNFINRTASSIWTKNTEDHSSRSTGSSLFDFEGDGIAEVLYADQCYFRIYNGETGEERFKILNSSGTLNEYPIVVDVDNDGKSEIVVGSNDFAPGSFHLNCDWYQVKEPTTGIRVFEDSENRWVRTRRIWNQHTYHITNVNEDGSIPQNEEHNWESYNNYRLNSQGKGVFNAPDLEITSIEKTRTDCPALSFSLKITVLNKGSLTVASELPISIYKGSRITPTEILGTIKTTKYLKPGESETLIFDFTPTSPDSNYNIFAIADDKGNGTGEYNECNENNNSKMISFKGIYNTYCQEGVGQCIRFAPYVCDNNNNLVC